MCCRNSADRRSLGQQGFTLLELLVVLVLVAFAAGLVLPSVNRAIDSASERGHVAELSALLEGLGVHAFRRAEVLTVDGPSLQTMLPDLPRGWRVEVSSAGLSYGPTGVSSGGEVRLIAPRRPPVVWRITALSGEVHLQPQSAGER